MSSFRFRAANIPQFNCTIPSTRLFFICSDFVCVLLRLTLDFVEFEIINLVCLYCLLHYTLVGSSGL